MLKKLMLVVSFALVACGGGDDKTSDTDCVTAFICAADCKTDACVQGCIDHASDEAQAQMEELGSCAADHGCDTAADTETCLQQKCGDELDACTR